MSFEAFSLLAALNFSLSAIFTRRGLDGSTPHTGSLVVLVANFAGFALGLALVDLSGLSFSWYWLAFAAAGVSSPGLSLFFLYRSIQVIGVAPTASLANTHAVFGALWAFILLGERPHAVVWIGIIAVAAGVYLISGGGGSEGRLRYLILPLASSACFGLAHTLRKIGFGGVDSAVFGGFLQGASAMLIGPFLLSAANRGRPYVFARRSTWNFGVAGLAMLSAQFLMLLGLQMGPVSRVTPLVATSPLFTLALAPVLIGRREPITVRIVSGAAIIVAGVVFVTAIR